MRENAPAWPIALVFACSFFAAASARADEEPTDESSVARRISDALKRGADPDGIRTGLEQTGLRFQFTYYGDALANPWGGVKQGAGYDGRFGVIVDADLAKLAGWTGATFHASAHQIHGSTFSVNNLDNLMWVSSIESPPSTRLFNLWIEQKLGTEASLRIGQFTASQEFIVSENADLFVNSTFGWPTLPADDLPSGGPAYPEATPGVRLAVTPTKELTLRAAIFNGDPAGPGPGNPVYRDPAGLAFRLRDPALLIAELAYMHDQDVSGDNPQQEGGAVASTPAQEPSEKHAKEARLPGALKLGAWLHTGRFPDQRFDALGGLLATSGLPPMQHAGNLAVYGVFDQMAWRSDNRSLSLFARASAAASDRNPIDFYADAGATFKGLLDGRPQDVAGLAFAYGRISPVAVASDRDKLALGGSPTPIRDFEATIELTYQISITDQWRLQPDLQYVIHPGGHISNPMNPSGASAIPNAFVLGLRTVLKF